MARISCDMRWNLRRGAVLLAMSAALLTRAQKPPELDYHILFAESFAQSQEKFIYEALTAQDPDVKIWIDPPTHSALARTHVHLDQVDLQSDMTIGGLVIEQLSLITPDNSVIRSDHDAIGDGFPEFIDTGNPDLDDATYQAAKAAWIAAHPAHYEQMTAPAAPE